ncbi:MAG: hypothetical protein D6739_02160 [Nitrospirae bacterium]|nr:MAG: hypothetical protein D6739_02160 [Nitrospirota bacterium]
MSRLALLLTLGLALLAAPRAAGAPRRSGARLDGRFSTLWLYATDSRQGDPRSTLRNRLRTTVLDPGRHLHLEFSGRQEIDLGRSAAGDRVDYQIQEAYLAADQLRGRFDLVVGRQYIPEAAATAIDGGRVAYHLADRWRLGAFAGATLKDNGPHIQRDFRSYGLFAAYESNDYRLQLSGVRDRFKGERDRDSVNLQASGRLGRKARLYTSATVDFGQPTNDPLLSNLYVDLDYRANRALSTSLIYSLFQTFYYLASGNPGSFDDKDKEEEPLLPDTSNATTTHRIEGRASYRLGRLYYFDTSLRYQLRTQDDLSNTQFSIGLRDGDLLHSQVAVAVRYTLSLSDALDTENFLLRLSRTFFDDLQVDATILHRRSALEIERVVKPSTVYSASAYKTFGRRWYAGLNLDYTREPDLRSATLFAQGGVRF